MKKHQKITLKIGCTHTLSLSPMFFVGWSTWVWKQPTSCETCPRNCGILSLDSNMDHSLRIWPGPVLKLKLKKIEHEVCGETLPGYHLLHSGAIGVFYTCKCSRASWTNKTNKKKVFSKAVCLFISINYAWSPQTAIIVNVAFEDKQRLIIC